MSLFAKFLYLFNLTMFLIIILIPRLGIQGYLLSLLVGQFIITMLDTIAVIRNVHFTFDAVNSLLKPGIIVALTGFILKKIYVFSKKITQVNEAMLVLSFCLLFCVISTIFFLITHSIKRNDFK